MSEIASEIARSRDREIARAGGARTRVILLVVAALVVAGVALAVRDGMRLPDEVQPIAWNAEPCAHCHMLIGDPAFAAQVITDDGDALSFDDPSCAARYLREHGHVHRAWFHDGRSARWLSVDEVGFVRVATSPMGSGLMAVPAATPGAIALEDVP